jgi:excisionase family DNA binding protein
MTEHETQSMTSEPMTNDQPIEDKQELISLAEAAKRYGFSHDYLRELARKGRLKAQKIAKTWLTTPADVEAYIASRQKRGAYRDDIGTRQNPYIGV